MRKVAVEDITTREIVRNKIVPYASIAFREILNEFVNEIWFKIKRHYS